MSGKVRLKFHLSNLLTFMFISIVSEPTHRLSDLQICFARTFVGPLAPQDEKVSFCSTAFVLRSERAYRKPLAEQICKLESR